MPLALLSPAKTFNEGSPKLPLAATAACPELSQNSAELLEICRGLRAPQIKKLMGVSDGIAALNISRFKNFADQPAVNAAVGFDGPAHRALDFASLGKPAQEYGQQHVATLSGLYGFLMPRDEIRPYRLEMGTKLENPKGSSLYDWWGDAIAAALLCRLGQLPAAQRFVVNVASAEYFKAVGKHLSKANAEVWTVEFPGPSVYAKQARGLYCRFLCSAGVVSAGQLTDFCAWSARPGVHGLPCSYRLAGKDEVARRLTFARVAGEAAGKSAPKKKPASKPLAKRQKR
jgi:cytoplasmic iron level regulating protein YaaA (DUF328/UPF0246 family)